VTIVDYTPAGESNWTGDDIELVLDHKRPETRRLFGYFSYDHLPSHLQAVSAPFWNLAFHMIRTQPETPELTVCLRKLLEAKDCAVRNAL